MAREGHASGRGGRLGKGVVVEQQAEERVWSMGTKEGADPTIGRE
jgi:hypothetical protein